MRKDKIKEETVVKLLVRGTCLIFVGIAEILIMGIRGFPELTLMEQSLDGIAMVIFYFLYVDVFGDVLYEMLYKKKVKK